jgi:hypothetical protein
VYPNGISSFSIGPYHYCKIHYCTVRTLCYCTVPHGLCGQAATGLSAFSIASILASGEYHFKCQHIAQLPSGTVSSALPLSRVHEQENSNPFIEHRPVCCTVQLQYSTVHAPAIYCLMCSTRPHVSSEILWWLLRCVREVASRPTNGLHLLPRGAYMYCTSHGYSNTVLAHLYQYTYRTVRGPPEAFSGEPIRHTGEQESEELRGFTRTDFPFLTKYTLTDSSTLSPLATTGYDHPVLLLEARNRACGRLQRPSPTQLSIVPALKLREPRGIRGASS